MRSSTSPSAKVARRLLVLGALAIPPGCASSASTTPAAGRSYANPVLDADFPDPTVLRAPDGWFYAYATQTERDGATLNLQVARSPDLVQWEHLGDALPAKPVWARHTQDFWAPHVSEHGGTYYLYYSAKPDAALADTSRGLCLAAATSASPRGPFADIGHPLVCGRGFENIDPMQLDDPQTGRRLLYWGSGFGPIMVRELGPDRVSFAPGSEAIALVHPIRSEDSTVYQRLVEGAWVTYREPWFYLFYSGDNCCGPRAHYAVMVARSRSATGPFETLVQATASAQSVILEQRDFWRAPGHNSVIRDANGDDWMVYHAVDPRRPSSRPGGEPNTRRVMLLDRIIYRGGWPEIAGGAPSTAPRPTPAGTRAPD